MNPLGWFCNKWKYFIPTDLPAVVERLSKKLQALREEFFFGIISALKSENIDIPKISPLLEEGSEIDSALKGFQLTCIVGFASKEGYVPLKDFFIFEDNLRMVMAKGDEAACILYNE